MYANNKRPHRYADPISYNKEVTHLCTRLGSSKNHIAKSTLKQDIQPFQHKGRRVPLNLTDKVDKEIRHLYDTKPFIKLDK